MNPKQFRKSLIGGNTYADDHEVAKQQLEKLAARSQEPLDPKAMMIFEAYLNCYSLRWK
jgi:hypothetical protein